MEVIMRVLVAEDDENIRNGLIEILKLEGYQTLAAKDGKEALELYHSESPDFICLDIMMPEVNGYDVCREIRKDDPTTPVIFISAKSEEIDKVIGLELGADDYIMKPFGLKEVIARIRAVTRRAFNNARKNEPQKTFTLDDLEVHPDELRAYRGDETIDLSLRDVKILELLFNNQGKAVNRDQLFNECWGIDYLPNSRTIDQHVSQLRKRIEKDPKNPVLVKTVHGVGYRYDE
jgi:two-component system, OmpR family, alkaline phosphatase synthesis response regulator PhoP